MKITELENPICTIYPDPEGNGFYAISDRTPFFCLHAPSMVTLGNRIQQMIKFYEKRCK